MNMQQIVENFVNEIRSAVRSEIAAELSGGSVSHSNGSSESNGAVAPGRGRSSKPASAALKKARKLQGRYLGGIRRLNAGQKKQVKKIRAEKGIDAALDLIQKMSAVA